MIAVIALVSVGAAACPDDTDDTAPEPTVAVDEDFRAMRSTPRAPG